ncbi:MAG TPA: group II intron reverse transcriptase/maturase [Candidatus Dormibacteraeota bacterium]|nr:group II intron reverse transcriptase/maturase [Candidatus Dormibacteraeota bacterium]
MSLTTPPSVQKLQTALHDKAKGSPNFRFYALYDKVYRQDVLEFAYDCCKANGGAPGVDGQTFEGIEEYGVGKWLDELAQELRGRTYQPQPVRRVWIPKPDGKQRPLGVPAIKDRVAQTAAVLVLEPIFEADLQPEQYAYRPNRSALDAVRHVHKLLNTGHGQIVDADLSGYFDSIPHSDLMKSVARRIVDGAMLHLIKVWLEAPVEETDEHGKKHRSTRNRDDGKGTPQGDPISPLLSNLYMRRFVLGWKKLGHEKRLEARIVNYADDLVICCRSRAEEALARMRDIMTRLKLTVNETKTRVCKLPGEKFDFLGYTFGQCYSPKTGRTYLGTVPSRKRVKRICETISELTGRDQILLDQEIVVARLNRVLTGWANYFSLGPVSKAYRAVDQHAVKRLRQWLCAKHKVVGAGTGRFPETSLYQVLGLVRLTARTGSLPWATS